MEHTTYVFLQNCSADKKYYHKIRDSKKVYKLLYYLDPKKFLIVFKVWIFLVSPTFDI
jgi:hypothetical protein